MAESVCWLRTYLCSIATWGLHGFDWLKHRFVWQPSFWRWGMFWSHRTMQFCSVIFSMAWVCCICSICDCSAEICWAFHTFSIVFLITRALQKHQKQWKHHKELQISRSKSPLFRKKQWQIKATTTTTTATTKCSCHISAEANSGSSQKSWSREAPSSKKWPRFGARPAGGAGCPNNSRFSKGCDTEDLAEMQMIFVWLHCVSTLSQPKGRVEEHVHWITCWVSRLCWMVFLAI